MLSKRMYQNSHLKERLFDFMEVGHSVCRFVVNKFRQFEGALFAFFVVFVFQFVTTVTVLAASFSNIVSAPIENKDVFNNKHRFNTGVFLCTDF